MSPRVAILGAGPAGSAFALNLLAGGVDPGDLVVLDKATFPRPKLCGGALTCRGTEALGALIGEPPGGVHTKRLLFRSSFGEASIVERGEQWLYDRAHLDELLLRRVIDAGVEVRQGCAVRELTPGVEGWRVESARGVSETFPWVVGADGACGVSRRASGLRGGRTGRLVEAVYEREGGDTAFDDETLLFDFDPVIDGIPGYAWIFPYPKPGAPGLYKIGVMDGRGVSSGRALRDWTERFAERSGFRRVDDRIAGWPERYYDWHVRGHRPGLMLVGEAFGVDALLGEGIAPALYHARYAAGRLREALDRGAARVRGYERGFLRDPEGWNLWFQARLADRIYGSAGNRWLRVLFDLDRLRELAEAGEDAYGRLARHMPSLCASYAWYILSKGLPPATPPMLTSG